MQGHVKSHAHARQKKRRKIATENLQAKRTQTLRPRSVKTARSTTPQRGTISSSIFLSRNGGPKPTQRAGDYSSLSR